MGCDEDRVRALNKFRMTMVHMFTLGMVEEMRGEIILVRKEENTYGSRAKLLVST